MNTRRLQLIALTAIGFLAIIGIVIVSTGSAEGGISLMPGQRDGDTEEITGTRQSIDAEDDATPEYFVDSVGRFMAEYGPPPNSDFARLRIPSIGIDAPVGLFIVDDWIMPEPQGPVDVAFYDLSGFRGLGGYPGQGGNAVFGGHVDLNRPIAHAGGVHYRGPAVFWDLDRLRAGDIIEVDYGGETLRYAVAWVQDLHVDYPDWGAIWSSAVEVDSITLFTCGGEFDFDTRSYSHRTVVRAERM